MKFFRLLKADTTIRTAFIATVIIWITLASIIIYSFSKYSHFYFEQRQDDAAHVLSPILNSYSEKIGFFETHFQELNDDMTKDDFLLFSNKLYGTDESVEVVYVAPLGVVEYVYPESKESTYLNYDIIANFSILELASFNDSLEAKEFFITYLFDSTNKVTDFIINKPIVDENGFIALAVIQIDIAQFISSLPKKYINDEIVLFTEDGNFLISSQEYNEATFRNHRLSTVGYEYILATNSQGDNFYKTQYACFGAAFIVTIPLLIVFAIFYEDQRKSKDMIKQLDYQKKHNIHTGIKNIVSLYSDIEDLIEVDNGFYLAFGVFNNVKYINDKYGHKVGQDLIIEATTLIQAVLRNHTEIYHYGGDEYAIVIKTNRKSEVRNILKRVLKVFDRDIVIERIRTNISMSIGVVSYPNQGTTVDELIKNAHLTLSSSNIINSNNFAFYSKSNVSNILINQEIDNYVKALSLELFDVYLMPIVDCKTNAIVGFECLTRAFNDFNEQVDTESIVNSLERNGRIQELDELVFKKMLRIMVKINLEFPDNEFFLSINASALSFNDKYVDYVTSMYQKQHFTKGTIVLELTESYKVEDYDYLIRLFARLNEVGIKTAIDDFGSGYSSLSYISRFPVYAIKVDKEYVKDYHENKFNRTLFMTLRSIAEVLDCKLVAEGVDDPDTLDFLKTNKCELYQGYLFSKGVPYEEAIAMIKDNLFLINEE